MTIKRHIAGLLLICFSAFLGHNLVPHHHHSEIYTSPISTDCPFEHGDHQGHDPDGDKQSNTHKAEHPTHCHAFNDVVFKKYNAPVNRPWSGQVQPLLASSPCKDLEDPSEELTSLFTLLKLPCSSHTDIGTRALRAPPAFA